VRQKADQRAGLLSLPHIGITKQKEIELQTKMIFGKKLVLKSNVLKTLAYLKRNMSNALRSKYDLCPCDGIHAIKHAVFEKIFAALTI